MLYGYYFRLYGVFHNEKISIYLAYILRFIKSISFWFKKFTHKKRIVRTDVSEAGKTVNSVYPKPEFQKPIYINNKTNDSVDLSIIVPVYNYAELIEKNINSILNQKTKYRFEAIFVDDGSTDGARDILDKYRTCKNVKVIYQQNMGIAGARNTGINNAVGKYIMFVDCDDTVLDNIVESLMDKAYSDDCDIVMCAHELVKEKDGKVLSVIPNIYPDSKYMGMKRREGIINYAGLPWCKVYKRELFENVRFFPGYWYEDTIVQFLLFTQCRKFAYVKNIGYEYKWYENNFSHVQNNSKNSKTIDRYWLLIDIIEQYEKIGLPKDKLFYELLIKHLSVYYLPSIAGLGNEVVDALFVLANDLLIKYRPKEKIKLPYMLRIIEKAILDKDINLWKLAAKYC